MRIDQHTLDGCLQCIAKLVDLGNRLFIRRPGIIGDVGIRHDLQAVIHPVKYDQPVGDHEHHVRISDFIHGNDRHTRFELGYDIVSEESDGSAYEPGERGIIHNRCKLFHMLLQGLKRIDVLNHLRRVTVGDDLDPAAVCTDNRSRGSADEGIATDVFTALDTFEQIGVRSVFTLPQIGADTLICGDGRLLIGKDLLPDRNQVSLLCLLKKCRSIG